MKQNVLLLFTTVILGAALTTPALAQCGASMIGPKATVAYQALPQARLFTQELKKADSSPAGGSMVGLWKVAFVSSGFVVDQAFDAWHSDGTETLNDTPPPSSGNVCLGVWSQKGNIYKLNHPSWTFDGNGNLTGTAVIREQVTVDSHGNSFSGTFTVDVYDLSNNLLYHLSGTVSGDRITAEQ
jgi:hypothetical protein